MHDDVAVIEHAPSALAQSLFAKGDKVFLFQLFLNGVAERAHLRRTAAAGDDKIAAHDRLIGNIQNDNVLRLFFRERFCACKCKFVSGHLKFLQKIFNILFIFKYYVWHSTVQTSIICFLQRL